MTCIVGLADCGSVYIGGDSAGVAGLDLTVRSDSKVFRSGEYVFGFTSSFRMGQLLRYKLAAPPPPDDDVHRFMATVFVDMVRECLKAGGYARKSNEEESAGCFLVGVRGRLFEIASDYQVGENLDGYAAVGCGSQVALGAMYAAPLVATPYHRIKTALEAAERFSAGVRAPFAIVRTEAFA